jgi:SufE protein probably involved in Fe-S center assembly
MFKEKIEEYKTTIGVLESMDSLEVYSYLMEKGKALNKDALSVDRQIQENKVTQCMYDLYVDKEDGRFKAWSEATIAAGYAFILVDIFNCMTDEEAQTVTVRDFEELELEKKLTMNRQTGYFQMIEIMINKIQ